MTYSIILRDPEKNHFGIAVATKHLAVGARVPFLEAGFGAIATQSTTNPYLGLKGLAYLRSGELIKSARLLQALFAGEEAGGDKRGRQSAALLTIREQPFPWCNLRVDDHLDPLMELTRLLKEFKEPYYQEFISQIPSK